MNLVANENIAGMTRENLDFRTPSFENWRSGSTVSVDAMFFNTNLQNYQELQA